MSERLDKISNSKEGTVSQAARELRANGYFRTASVLEGFARRFSASFSHPSGKWVIGNCLQTLGNEQYIASLEEKFKKLGMSGF